MTVSRTPSKSCIVPLCTCVCLCVQTQVCMSLSMSASVIQCNYIILPVLHLSVYFYNLCTYVCLFRFNISETSFVIMSECSYFSALYVCMLLNSIFVRRCVRPSQCLHFWNVRIFLPSPFQRALWGLTLELSQVEVRVGDFSVSATVRLTKNSYKEDSYIHISLFKYYSTHLKPLSLSHMHKYTDRTPVFVQYQWHVYVDSDIF